MKAKTKSIEAVSPNKAVIYCRVSSREQEKEGFSIPAQRKLLCEYAAKKGLTVVCEFEDVESAAVSGREGFGKMLVYLRRHKDVRKILVEKVDRLSRNFEDLVLLNKLDLEIHLPKDNRIISRNSMPSERLAH